MRVPLETRIPAASVEPRLPVNPNRVKSENEVQKVRAEPNRDGSVERLPSSRGDAAGEGTPKSGRRSLRVLSPKIKLLTNGLFDEEVVVPDVESAEEKTRLAAELCAYPGQGQVASDWSRTEGLSHDPSSARVEDASLVPIPWRQSKEGRDRGQWPRGAPVLGRSSAWPNPDAEEFVPSGRAARGERSKQLLDAQLPVANDRPVVGVATSGRASERVRESRGDVEVDVGENHDGPRLYVCGDTWRARL
jgi:hypothetical protein